MKWLAILMAVCVVGSQAANYQRISLPSHISTLDLALHRYQPRTVEPVGTILLLHGSSFPPPSLSALKSMANHGLINSPRMVSQSTHWIFSAMAMRIATQR